MSWSSAGRRHTIWVLALLIAVAACSSAMTGPGHPADWPCVNGRPDEIGALYPASNVYKDPRITSWPSATPDEVGLDGETLDRAASEVGLAPRVTSLLIARHGRLAMERYFNDATDGEARNLHSATKSLLGMVVGIAIDDGHLAGLEVPIGELLPDVVGDSPVAAVTIGEMLSMSAGLAWDDVTSPDDGASIIDSVVRAERVAEPGTVFEYNSGLSNLVALALDRVVPGGLCRYAHAELLTPLAIDVDRWHENPEGAVAGGTGAFVTPRELARLGQLVLDGGKWHGRQLVPPAWIEGMLTPSFELATPNLRRGGHVVSYGLHWWIHDIDGTRVWNASGYGGQELLVIPSLDMVVVLTHDTAGPVDRQVPWPDLLTLFILPAAGDPVNECPCPPDFFRAHLDGSGRAALAPNPANELAADWSPDGARIAFHSFRDLNAELYLMNADGTEQVRLTTTWAIDAGPKWSPDGRHIAFMSDRSADEPLSAPAFDVHVLDLETGVVERVTATGDVRSLDWSPSGDRIAYVRGGGFDGLGELWVVDLEAGTADLLLPGPVGFPAWSPDGGKIALDVPSTPSNRVGILHLAPEVVVDFGPGGLAAWSGDGARVFVTVDGTTLIAIDMVDGSRVTLGPMPYGVPSPDGEWILFTASRG